MNTYFYLDSNNSLDFKGRQKDVDIIIRLVPHPKGSAEAVVSLHSAELSVSQSDLRNNRFVAFLEEKLKLPKTASSLSRGTAETTLERSDDSPQGEVLQKPHKSGGVSFLTLINLFKVRRATIRKFRIVRIRDKCSCDSVCVNCTYTMTESVFWDYC